MALPYARGFLETVEEVVEFEAAGLQIVFVPEAYSFDAVSQLGFIAARTTELEIASGIMQLYSRTPTLIAMTSAGLDYVSGGRFTLGIGASGPQVVEGLHGVPFTQPLDRTREVIEVCRKIWRREVLVHEGHVFRIPLPQGSGTGLSKPLRIINHPVREHIPIMVAALGPRSVAQVAEIAEAWQPAFFFPERADKVWGAALRSGLARRQPGLGPLDTIFTTNLAVGDDVAALKTVARNQIALYVGGMGARGKNFYRDVAVGYGFGESADLITDLYLSGRKAEAAAAVPDELVDGTNLIGPLSWIKERLEVLAAAGVTTLNVTPLAPTFAARCRDIEILRSLAA
jgi:F420-dependent oxidoreductase-like protein